MNELTGLIQLDFRSGEGIAMQIVRQIQELVQKGVLKQGDQLPTVRELATELRINFSTVARAYKTLDEQQIISTQRGRGTYIWDEPPPERLEEQLRQNIYDLAQRYISDAVRLGATVEAAVDAVTRAAYQYQSENDSKNVSSQK